MGERAVAKLQAGESAERGRAARSRAPRGAHGEWAPAADRADPVALLMEQAASRVQELVPIRYGRMLVSPFTFYRGAAAVMAADLARTPDIGHRRAGLRRRAHRQLRRLRGTRPPAGVQSQRLRRDAPGPWEWDVKRMAASAEIAGRDVGLSADHAAWIVRGLCARVPRGDAAFAGESHLDVWYERLNAASSSIVSAGSSGAQDRIVFAKPFAKARRKTSLRAVKKLTERVDGRAALPQRPAAAGALPRSLRPRRRPARRPTSSASSWRSTPPAWTPTGATCSDLPIRGHGAQGRRRRERRHAGLGLPARRPRAAATRSCCRPRRPSPRCSSPISGASEFENHGERVVRGQRMSQAASDIFLSWQRSEGLDGEEHDFYVRQLWDWKASADLARMDADRPSCLHAGLWLVAGPNPRPLWRPPRDRRLPRRRSGHSTGPSPASPPPTPTRTSSTTSDWLKQSPRAKSTPCTGSSSVEALSRVLSRRP